MGQGCIQSLRDSSCIDRYWDVDLRNDDNDFCGGLLFGHFGCKDVAVDVSLSLLAGLAFADHHQAFTPDGAVTNR